MASRSIGVGGTGRLALYLLNSPFSSHHEDDWDPQDSLRQRRDEDSRRMKQGLMDWTVGTFGLRGMTPDAGD